MNTRTAFDDPREARALRADLVRRIADEVRDPIVLEALRVVPRHLFVPSAPLRLAYLDQPLPIGYEQTISQPTIVAVMTDALELTGRERVLEIGTGSGYQAAVLSLLAAEVYSIEVVPELAAESAARLCRLGYGNVHVRAGDGYAGWPEAAPFDRVLVTAAPTELPDALLQQLAPDGILVAPVGGSPRAQRLLRYRKAPEGLLREDLGGVRFVPMVPAESA